jgi:hypothetical protein
MTWRAICARHYLRHGVTGGRTADHGVDSVTRLQHHVGALARGPARRAEDADAHDGVRQTGRAVAAQVEFESIVSKRFIIF